MPFIIARIEGMIMFNLNRKLLISVFCLFLVIACSDKLQTTDNSEFIEQSSEFGQIIKLDVTELAQKIRSGEFSAEQVTQAFLNRIEHIDRNGPKLNSVIEINPDALDIAKTLDVKFSTDKNLGSLYGIPVLLKANIACPWHDRQ